ncbi:MAG: hypothetical protein V4850_32755 [Myxococcota bacterium]
MEDRPIERAVRTLLRDTMYERDLAYRSFAAKINAPYTTIYRMLATDDNRLTLDVMSWLAKSLDLKVEIAITDTVDGYRTVFLPTEAPTAPPEKLADWRPSDLAQVVGGMDEQRRAALFKIVAVAKKVPPDVLDAMVKTLEAWDR